ncbi:hypothetical protein EK904_012357 [Melospiza melodia maxima]|nr:hypothetical protein EK904_012357 [Melospiza melodia maxima]
MLKLNSLFNESLKFEESTSDSQICDSSRFAVEEIYEAFEEEVHLFEPKKLHCFWFKLFVLKALPSIKFSLENWEHSGCILPSCMLTKGKCN